MKAIQTKYLPPTNTKGLRIKAFDFDGNSVTISAYNLPGDDLSDSACRHAAHAFLNKMDWPWDKSKLVSGAVKDGYIFCNGNQ